MQEAKPRGVLKNGVWPAEMGKGDKMHDRFPKRRRSGERHPVVGEMVFCWVIEKRDQATERKSGVEGLV